MYVDSPPIRLAPRWLHIWAILTVIVTAVLLILGSLVTTFRVGMADPIWPTTPWFLFSTSWSEPRPGFLIEHTHRLAGFTVGIVTAILALSLWWTDPRAWSRWLGLIGLVGLLATFWQFHREMMKQVHAEQFNVPVPTVQAMAAALTVVVVCGGFGLVIGSRGAGIRLLGVVALVGVMIQGLLGGFRVKLNALMGTDLAVVHGIFAQVVFGLLISLAVLTARPTSKPELSPLDRSFCRRLAIALSALVFLQLIWGAMVRHNPTSAVQRLHLITAFIVVAVAVWLIKSARQSTTTWNRLGRASVLLTVLLALQIVFGVEAWMGKFAGNVLPDMQNITTGIAVVRTIHFVLGTAIMATSISLMLLTRRPIKRMQEEFRSNGRTEAPVETAFAGAHQLGGTL